MTIAGADQPADSAIPRRRLPTPIWPLALTYLAIAMNVTIANVALPTLSVELDATATQLTWIVSSTPLVSAAFILFAGGIGDRLGRRAAVLTGLGFFLVTALLSGFATDPNQLIALRGLTGVASALTMPAALALVFALTVGPSQRTAVGLIGATQAVGALLGPIVAGLALVTWGWPAAFWSVTPMLLVAALWLLIALPRHPRPQGAPQSDTALDVVGGVLAAVVGASVVFATIVVASATRTDDFFGLIALGLASVSGVLLWWWERRVHHPMFVGAIMRQRTFWVPTLTIVTVQFTLGGLVFLSQQYLQLALGLSAFGAALMLLPALVAWAASSVVAGAAARRFGVRRAVVVGLAVSALGMLVLSTAGRAPAYGVWIVALVLTGAMGLAPALMTHAAVSNYPAERRSIGSAINGAASRFGLAFGVAVTATVATLIYRSGVAAVLESVPGSDLGRESLGGALKLALSIGGPTGDAIMQASLDAFVAGFRAAILTSAVVLVATAIVVWRFLPKVLPGDQTTDSGISSV